jgi:membrane-associated phospholipid phosphatase
MNYIRKFLKENIHFLYLLIFMPLLIVFYICEEFINPKYIIHAKFDDYIPFIKFFIVPYLFWFLYMAIGFVYFALKSKEDFIKLTKFIFLGMSISYATFILFPNMQNMRPVLGEKDVFSNLVGFIYSIDTPENVFPSIHVINAIAVNAVVLNSQVFNDKKRIKILSAIIMVLICASTVFIKQHSIIDVVGGVGLSGILYFFIYSVPGITKRKHRKEVGENN